MDKKHTFFAEKKEKKSSGQDSFWDQKGSYVRVEESNRKELYCMVIDAHAHVYDILTGYGARGEFRPLGKGRGIWANGDVEQFFPEQYGDLGFHGETLLKLMEEAGVDHAILLQGGNYGFHNDYVAEMAAAYPEKFTGVGTLDPYAQYAQEILEHLIRDYKFRALKFEISQTWGMTGYHPDLKMDGPVFAPILERANQLGLTVVIDMGPMGTASFDVEPLKKIAARYPDILFVMTHCFFPKEDGNNGLRLEYMKELASDHFVFDISNVSFSAYGTFLKEVKETVGVRRMLWGTDLPGILNRYTYSELINGVKESGIFTEDELALVMGENAKRVYKTAV